MRNKIVVILTVLSVIFSCDNSDHDLKSNYSQLTNDDLSYVIYDKDSLYLVDKSFSYVDKIKYLYNDTLVVEALIMTEFYSSQRDTSISDFYNVGGRTEYRFINCPILGNASSSVIRDSEFGFSHLNFTINSIYDFWGKGSYSTDTTIVKDTATILGVLYNDVLKFDINPNNPNIKTVYFAKKYGYIKIEAIDGNCLQRIRK